MFGYVQNFIVIEPLFFGGVKYVMLDPAEK